MATAEDIQDVCLKTLIVAGAEASVDASDSADFISALNNFMNMMAQKTSLSWTVISSLADTVVLTNASAADVSAGAVEPIAYAVAKRLAPQYGAPVSNELRQLARDGEAELYRLGATTIAMSMPARLPKGAGHDDSSFLDDNFFKGSTS